MLFRSINLEDISAPRCFEIEEILKQELDIPVFHDDQHGTAIVVLAGLMNALRVTKRCHGEPFDSSHHEQCHGERSRTMALRAQDRLHRTMTPSPSLDSARDDTKIVISGAGAAGTAITRLLLSQGFRNILICDRAGIINRKRDDLNSAAKTFLAAATNPENAEGSLAEIGRAHV